MPELVEYLREAQRLGIPHEPVRLELKR
jgi:hypothetical protein